MDWDLNPKTAHTTDFAEELLRRAKTLSDKTKKNVWQSYIKYKRYYDKKAKASPLKGKDYCFKLQPNADQQGSKIPFLDFRWIGPHLIQKILPNNYFNVRKLTTNKTQILNRIRLRKYNPGKPLEDNYQKAQWQIDDNKFFSQDDLYTLAWEAEFRGHLVDIPIIYTDPNAIVFDESHSQGRSNNIIPRSYFRDSSDGQKQATCPIADPFVVHSSNLESHVQNQDVEMATDIGYNEVSEQLSASSTETETAYEPIQQPPSRQSDDPSTIEINDPANEKFPQNESSRSRGGK